MLLRYSSCLVMLAFVAVLTSPALGLEIHVSADGSGDVPTIQAAIDAADADDVIVLADGIYVGPGNRNLVLGSRDCRLRSASGDALACVIDLQGQPGLVQTNPYRLQIEGLTLTNGNNVAGGGALHSVGAGLTALGCRFIANAGGLYGAAIYANDYGMFDVFEDCEFAANTGNLIAAMYFNGQHLTMRRCVFRDHSGSLNSVVWKSSGNSRILDCVFRDNAIRGDVLDLMTARAEVNGCLFLHNDSEVGGAANLFDASATFRGCTFLDNGGAFAGDINFYHAGEYDELVIDRCLIAFTRAPHAVSGHPVGRTTVTCSDIFTAGGGWHPSIVDQLTSGGNLDADPLICDLAGGDLRLADISPCLPANNPCGELMGLHGLGCESEGYLVYPDGHGALATIQAAIDVAPAGGEVLLADGVFAGAGNRALDFRGKALTLRSLSGEPSACVIDSGGEARGFHFHGGEDSTSVVSGLTVRGGRSDGAGGAVLVEGASPRFDGCRFEDGWAVWGGGVAARAGARPVLRDCVFVGNEAVLGAAVAVLDAHLAAFSCTVAGNHSDGAALYAQDGSLRLAQTLVAHNTGGLAAWIMPGADIHLTACDIFGNEGGDWTEPFVEQLDLRDNFLAPPCFCDLAAGGVTLCADSWCLPENNPLGNGLLVGALGAGCAGCGCGGPVAVQVSGFYPVAEPGEVTCHFRMILQEGEFPIVTAQRGDQTRNVYLLMFNEERFYMLDDHPSLAAGGQITYRLYATPARDPVLREMTVTVPPLGGTTLLAHPNPFNPATTITYRVDTAGPATVAVFDLRGRLVTTLLRADLPVGEGHVVWNGRDDSGRGAEAGTYLCRLESAGGVRTVAVTLVK